MDDAISMNTIVGAVTVVGGALAALFIRYLFKAWKSGRDAAKPEIDRLRADVDELKDEKTKLEAETADLKSRLVLRDDHINRLQHSIATQAADLQAQEARADRAVATLRQYRTQYGADRETEDVKTPSGDLTLDTIKPPKDHT